MGDLSRVATAPVFSWNTAEAKRNFESFTGTPADFIRVDREVYHEVDCYVFLNSRGNQSDRYYMAQADGRWYGHKMGIIAIPDDPDSAAHVRDYKLAVEEVLGKKLGEKATWPEIDRTLRRFPQDKKIVWYRWFYAGIRQELPSDMGELVLRLSRPGQWEVVPLP